LQKHGRFHQTKSEKTHSVLKNDLAKEEIFSGSFGEMVYFCGIKNIIIYLLWENYYQLKKQAMGE
jgi:hypothetical protein